MGDTNGSIREFNGFHLNIRQKFLWFEDKPVPMPLKELELLCLLVEREGELVTKAEILDKIWENSYVEESNLSRHIYLLRKTFKDFGLECDLIENVPRRGYRFIGKINNGIETSFVVERHSLTKTLIEDLSVRKAGDFTTLAGIASFIRSKALFLCTATVLVFLPAVVVWQYARSKSEAESLPRVSSIAVIPFKTLDPNPKNNLQGLGLVDILITRLSSLKGLTVRPSSAVMELGNEKSSSMDLGKRLKVDAVLEGTIYRSRKEVRITTRLIDVRNNSLLWTGHFEKPVKDEFKLQNEIALQLVNALSIKLSASEENALEKVYTENAESYRLYIEGRYNWNKRSNPGMSEAERLFRNAIERDPEFALAYVGLADTLGMLHDRKDAISAIEKALELDPDLAEAHAALGFSHMFHDWDWAKSELELKKSIELNPGYATAHQWYATLLSIQQRYDESLVEIDKALEIDPMSHNFLADKGQIHYFAGDYKKAEDYCKNALKIYPDFASAHAYLADIYFLTGKFEYSIDETYHNYLLEHDFANLSSVNREKIAQKFAGDASKYKKRGIEAFLFDKLEESNSSPNIFYRNAQIYAFFGNNLEALDNLEKAYAQKAFMLAFVKADPKFGPIRSEPRFQDLLRKMKLGV